MHDRSVRNLAHLQASGSTARVLNLLAVSKAHGDKPEFQSKPFFKNAQLNRCIILKHRLRRNELDVFPTYRTTATKIIVPIDSSDLKLGGRYLFVDQIGYDNVLAGAFGEGIGHDSVDRRVLELLDQLPSLDPFLLREQLRRIGVEPAACYFDVSPGDMQRMFAFVEDEIRTLVNLCYGGEVASATSAARLVRKILSTQVDMETEPLRQTLRLAPDEYQEGVFCWKGFLFYKWTLASLMADVGTVITEIETVRTHGATSEMAAYLETTRASVRWGLLTACDTMQAVLANYDDAYARLVSGKPQIFRDFLLDAPRMFNRLGEHLGAIQHIVSFWRFRFPKGSSRLIAVEELEEIFMDFEQSLALPEGGQPNPAAALRHAG